MNDSLPSRSGVPHRGIAAVFSAALVMSAAAGNAAAREVPRLLMPPGSPAKTVIHWWNGESLEGELTGTDAEFLVWKSGLFTDPLRVRKDVIRRVDFAGGFLRAAGSFRIALTDGSHLTGEVADAGGETLTIQSPLCGTVVIKRDQIVCLERINGPGIIAGGPAALLPGSAGARAGGGSGIPLFLAAAGRVASPAFNLASQRPLDVPDKSLTELFLRSDSIPDFSLKLADDKAAVAVETWGDELVLVMGEQFASAGLRLTEKDRYAHIRLAWDRSAGRCALYGADGKLWAEITAEKSRPEPEKKPAARRGSWFNLLFGGGEVVVEASPASAKPAKGITLLNKGSGIIVERFCVSEWQGTAPPPLLSDVACVETDSAVISGEPAARNGDNLAIRTADGATREVPLPSVRAIRWPHTAKLERDPALTDLWIADGNLVRGNLKEVKDYKAVVETAFATGPVTVELKGCHAIVLANPDKKPASPPALDKLDVVTGGGITLHGTIAAEGGPLPRFLPVGAAAALTPADSKGLSMMRSLPSDGKYERAPALLHVKSGETLPVTLRGVSRDRVEFAWEATEVHELAPSELHAVQFSAPAAGTTGFDGHGWRMTGDPGKTSPERKGGAILLRPGSGIGNPFLLQGGEVSFRMAQDSGLATLRIRLFCQGADRDSNSINFLVGNFGSEIYCGLERTEGQLESQTEVPSRSPTEIRFSFPGDKVEMYVNGVRAAQTPVKGRIGRKSGTGIVIETASLWGNQVGSVKISELVMQASPCMAGPPAFSEDARREALLLPRLRRDDPPRHVLIGRNGDLLRGEIEAMTATHLSFRSGLENFKVPLDRVSAAVWVKRPDKSDPGKTAAADKPEEEAGQPGAAAGAPVAGGFALNLVRLVLRRPVIQPPVVNPNEDGPVPAEAAEPVVDQKPNRTTDSKSPSSDSVQWIDLTNGGRIALRVESWGKEKVVGQHSFLGRCSIPTSSVYSFTPRAPGAGAALAALADWKLELTPDPVLPEDEGTNSPLTGKSAASFSLPMLEGGNFSLSAAKGKVVVLDFWATWCGPCVKSLPGLIETMATFPEDKVVFVAVNQGETKDQVKKFLEARELHMAVAFDADAKVARQYGVEGIPHSVVIDPDGKIAFTKTGYEADGDKKIAEAVRKALGEAGAEKSTGGQGESGIPKSEDQIPVEPLLPPPDLQ